MVRRLADQANGATGKMTTRFAVLQPAQTERTDLMILNDAGPLWFLHQDELRTFVEMVLGVATRTFDASLLILSLPSQGNLIRVVEQGVMPQRLTLIAGGVWRNGAAVSADLVSLEADDADFLLETEQESLPWGQTLKLVAVEDQVLAQAVRTFLQDVRFNSALVVNCRCFVDAFSFFWRHELCRVHDRVVAVPIADGATY